MYACVVGLLAFEIVKACSIHYTREKASGVTTGTRVAEICDYVISCRVVPCRVVSYRIMSCNVMSYHAKSILWVHNIGKKFNVALSSIIMGIELCKCLNCLPVLTNQSWSFCDSSPPNDVKNGFKYANSTTPIEVCIGKMKYLICLTVNSIKDNWPAISNDSGDWFHLF